MERNNGLKTNGLEGFNMQPVLENKTIILYPLEEEDFSTLYAVASDPEIWEQHPNKDRWKEDVFKTFFDDAMKSKGAFKIIDKINGNTVGSTRLYDYNPQENSIVVGYTFCGIQYWGKGTNHSVKTLLLDYLFQFVSKVHFHIGAHNIRSQIAIGRIGAEKIAEQRGDCSSPIPQINFIYEISRENWGKAE
ncbi:GNAT family N-acetyltransferase [Chryseobacterium sp.]|uniref:GNAT family N-acetyltransferase n=1 Tax=Chryseobacterium sp. TaxID=1871047 RepID=UPI0025C1BB9A|nr:GNAT family N-acetyltransferase [Chryseobacterium sp.]MBV8325190.1 GNAT family N-acetyltransferase [Chryseobacterium sp.]